jgi:hypothetical protein
MTCFAGKASGRLEGLEGRIALKSVYEMIQKRCVTELELKLGNNTLHHHIHPHAIWKILDSRSACPDLSSYLL